MIEVLQTRSFGEVPSIDITFSNGVKDSMVLKRFYPTQESRMAGTSSCNFVGHLENEKSACVSLTGCTGSDDLYFTINSKNSGLSNMYILRNNSEVELVESVFKVKHEYQSSSNKVMHSPVKDFITRTLIITLYLFLTVILKGSKN